MIEYFLAGVKVGLFGLGFALFTVAVILCLLILTVLFGGIINLLTELKWQFNNYRKYGRRK